MNISLAECLHSENTRQSLLRVQSHCNYGSGVATSAWFSPSLPGNSQLGCYSFRFTAASSNRWTLQRRSRCFFQEEAPCHMNYICGSCWRRKAPTSIVSSNLPLGICRNSQTLQHPASSPPHSSTFFVQPQSLSLGQQHPIFTYTTKCLFLPSHHLQSHVFQCAVQYTDTQGTNSKNVSELLPVRNS